jgi:DNA helicase-2/ATP-dependent DNA helicase PcrA
LRSAGSSLHETPNSFSYESPKKRGHASNGTIIEGEAWLVPSGSNDSAFEIGARVFHQKFGYGKILSSDGNKLEVAFEKAGTKKVIDSFVDPA